MVTFQLSLSLSDSPATFPVHTHTQLLKNGAWGFMGFLLVRPDTLTAGRCLIECVLMPLNSWSGLICGWFFL